jgi:glycosyltransferase involved in cell wall biosynthesis
MRIAHIAPPWIPVPPRHYGGTENVIYNLVEEQVAQGHDVTLFAPGDARSSAKHVHFFETSLYEQGLPWESHPMAFYHLYKSLEYLKAHMRDFDILHTHLSSSSDIYLFPLADTLRLPHVTTLHSQFPFDRVHTKWQGDADRYYMEWIARTPMVAISRSAQIQEQAKFPLNIIDVVHHGINLQDFPMPIMPDDFFVWLGRIVPEKGVHLAIEAAKKARVPLIIAGLVDHNIPTALRYFQEEIEPQIDGKQIQFIGPVNQQERNDLLHRAQALLNPLQWEEPFGMVMLEAMAAGCPVISFRRGAAEELLTSPEVGFLVDDVDEMVAGMQSIALIDRWSVRDYVETHFSASIMAKNYTSVYKRVIGVQENAALVRLTRSGLYKEMKEVELSRLS